MTFERMMELLDSNKLTLRDVVESVDTDNGRGVIKFIETIDRKDLERLTKLAVIAAKKAINEN